MQATRLAPSAKDLVLAGGGENYPDVTTSWGVRGTVMQRHKAHLKSPVDEAPLPPPRLHRHGQTGVRFLALQQVLVQPSVGVICEVAEVLVERHPPAAAHT